MVTCGTVTKRLIRTVLGDRRRAKVSQHRCATALAKGTFTLTTPTAEAALMRDGLIWDTGTASDRGGQPRLVLSRTPTPGRYILALISRHRHRETLVLEAIVAH